MDKNCINGRAMNNPISGVTLTPLKKISVNDGEVLHIMKDSDYGYHGFGEVYLSEVMPGCIKGWKNHQNMVVNLSAPYGSVKVVIFDDRVDSISRGKFVEYIISRETNYSRITIMPGLWFGFQCLSESPAAILNVGSIRHDPTEVLTKCLSEINFDWRLK